MIIRFILLASLVKLLQSSRSPVLCASIYVGASLLFTLLLGRFSLGVLFGSAISFGLSWVYFWLLNYFEDGGIIFYAILIGGLVIGLV